MISEINPVDGLLRPALIDRNNLQPDEVKLCGGGKLFCFVDHHIDIVRLDFVFDAGTAVQEKLLQAGFTVKQMAVSTRSLSAHQLAEFFDSKGIVLEKHADTMSSSLTFYTLKRYVDVLFPVVYEIITRPVFDEDEFLVRKNKQRQRILANMHKTAFVARKEFYRCLYGATHPHGVTAEISDIDAVSIGDITRFHEQHCSLASAYAILSGDVDDSVIRLFDSVFGQEMKGERSSHVLPPPMPEQASGIRTVALDGTVQNTVRIGRILPFAWNTLDYASFMILSTALGGYFGSRLMSNLREEKGYTYGIQAYTMILNNSLLFYVASDVAADKAETSLEEIGKEIDILRREPVGAEELNAVRNCMLGDFMRSIDGVFERCERFKQMIDTGVTELFTDIFMSVLDVDSPQCATPAKLLDVAQRYLAEDELLFVNVGHV